MENTIIINPATGEKITEYNRITIDQVLEKINQSNTTYASWKQKSFKERAAFMHKLADILDENKEEYAQLATQEMGKVIGQSRKEIEKCALVCRYYADNTEALLKDEIIKTEATKSYVTFQPIGVVLAVMPWNFPFYQVIRFAAPALMAGNTAVLKHASNVQGCALALEQAFAKAGFPEGAFTNLNIDSKLVKAVIEDKNIVAVTLTGSDPAGRSVASIAGQNLKKTVMELGGSDAYIVLDDVDLEEATDLSHFGTITKQRTNLYCSQTFCCSRCYL